MELCIFQSTDSERSGMLYSKPTRDGFLIENQLCSTKEYPQIFDIESNVEFLRPITKEEFISILESFARDKFLSPDGWIVEIFLHFFELMEQDFLDMVEES